MLNNLEVLSKVLLEDASHEARMILDKARKEASGIKEEGVRVAEELQRTQKKSRSQVDLVCYKAKMISLAEFKARSEILARKEEILNGILSQLRREFLSLPGKEGYPELLERLIEDALKHLEGEGREFFCQINAEDQRILLPQVLERIGAKLVKGISLDTEPVAISGGAIVQRADQRVLYDNSLEAIFERKRQHMRCMAAEFLFGNRCDSLKDEKAKES